MELARGPKGIAGRRQAVYFWMFSSLLLKGFVTENEVCEV